MWCQLTELENAFPSLGNLNPPTTAKSGNSSRSKHALPHAVTIKHCRSCEHFFVLGSNPFNLRLLGSISLSQSCAPPWALLCTSHIPTAQTALWVSARSPLYPVNQKTLKTIKPWGQLCWDRTAAPPIDAVCRQCRGKGCGSNEHLVSKANFKIFICTEEVTFIQKAYYQHRFNYNLKRKACLYRFQSSFS